MTFNGVDLSQYIKGIQVSGRGQSVEKEEIDIPGASNLEGMKIEKLNRIIVKGTIVGSTHTEYRNNLNSVKNTLSGTSERILSFPDSTNTYLVFVEHFKIDPHKPISSCLSADVEIVFVGRLSE